MPTLFAVVLCAGLIATPLSAGALHEAVRDGDAAAAERLIAAGVDLEAKDDAALTPLIVAALTGKKQTVGLLIAKGADPRGRDGKGFTALHAAAHAGHLDIVKLFIDRGLDVNDRGNAQKLAPLHLAAERDHLDVAATLLAQGADVDIKQDHGRPPIWLAVLKRHAAMVKLLRDHGAKCPKSKLTTYNDFCMNAGT